LPFQLLIRIPVERSGEAPGLHLYTGRFVERKGVRELIAAIPRVLEHAPETRFVLASGHRHCSGAEMEHWWLPPELQEYRSRIHFTGWLTPEQLAGWYAAADVLVVPSWHEPFGMVILEGMLYGLPIAAADVGGPAEILEHNRTGVLFAPRDVEALAQEVTRLVMEPDLRRRIGTAAADEVRHKWLWPHIVSTMRDVYLETMNA
jgi:glycosyltransferase involved in cell wall biosynthesis